MMGVKACTALLVLAMSAATANANDYGALALDLGNIVGSEQHCGLVYDQEAIEAFVKKRVPDDDMEFLRTMNNSVDATAYRWDGFSDSHKTVHCTQVKRLAKKFGFVK